MPERIQQRRTKGWRKPENTVSVARPSIFGNPFTVASFKQVRGGRVEYSVSVMGGLQSYISSERRARQVAVDEYRRWLGLTNPDTRHMLWWLIEKRAVVLDRMTDLAGKNLMCFCPLDQPCHADVLLELANRGPTDG